MSRRLSICFAIIAGLAATLLHLKELPFFTESLEQRFVFDPLPVDRRLLSTIPSIAHGVEEVHLAMPDGVVLHGWLKRPARLHTGERYPLVIVYGGVRHEISEFVQEARAPGGWGWLMVNYRGFGLSGGVPTEHALIDDAKRVYDWAASQNDVDAANIVVLGRSFGSYVAVTVAAARRARAAILATPFDSAVALGEKRFPLLPVRWLIGDRFDPASFAPGVSVPALFVLAENDEITPVENGRALAQKWGGLKQMVMLRGATHSGIEESEEFWGSVGTFLKSLAAPALTVSSVVPSRGR